MGDLERRALQHQVNLLSQRVSELEVQIGVSGREPVSNLIDRATYLPPWWKIYADPAVTDIGHISQPGVERELHRYTPGDPAVTDIARLSRVQIEATLHSLAADKVRLDGLETLLRAQLQDTEGAESRVED